MAFPPGLAITDGATIFNKTWGDAYDADIASALVDGTSGGGAGSSQTPAETTAEVIDARDGEASLLTKLVAMEGAFTGVGPSAIRNGFVSGNHLANDTFLMWSRGDAAAPDHWTLSGTGAAVARCGTGQADTNAIPGQDHFSARLTYGSAAAILEQQVMNAGITGRTYALAANKYPPIVGGASNARRADYDADVDGQLNAYVIGHVMTATAGSACVAVNNDADVASPYHPGDGAWYSLVAGPVVSAGSVLAARCRVDNAGLAYFQCIGLFLTPLALPPMYLPGRVRYVSDWTHFISGNLSTGDKWIWGPPARPRFILGMTVHVLTAPTVSAVKFDLQTLVGGAWVSLYATLPQIAASKFTARSACDPAAANYRRRTIRGVYAQDAAALADNSLLKLSVDTDDGGNTSADAIVQIHALEYDRPLDQFRSMTDLGE